MAPAVLAGVLLMGEDAATGGRREVAVEAATVHFNPVLGFMPSSETSLLASKGHKDGMKFEHGRPGHTAARPKGSLIARRGAEKSEKPERRG